MPDHLAAHRPRKQRIVVITVALILAAVAVAGTIHAVRADRRPADERPAVVARIRVAHAPSAVAGTIRAFRADHRPADEGPRVVARIRVAHAPSAIAAGRHAIWVLSAATLSRIDPQTDRVAGAVRIPGAQYGDVAVTHDAVWVMSAGTGTLSRIDPETDRVVGAVRITGQRNPGQDSPVAVTHDAVWVAVFGEIGANGKVHGGSLVRVDPGTMQIAARLPISGIVALEPGMGSLWANQIPSGTPPGPLKGSVYRVDPSTDEVHAVLTDAFLSPRMVVAGGFVWVYDQQNRAIERVDPRTGRVSRIGSEPVSIGAGDVTDSLAYADGSLWFPGCGADAMMCPATGPLSVRRLDVSTGELSTIPLGISGTIEKTASGHIERNVGLHVVAADANSVWLMVANQTWKGNRTAGYWGGRLIRIELTTGRVQAVTIGAYDLGGLIADGDLWLADSQHHSVLRVDP